MSNGDIFVGEVIGTAILILFGAGVCAAVTLHHSKARAAGWVVIAFGWGFGVLAGAYTAAPLSGGHLNPAVTVGIAVDTGKWDKVPLYILGQLVGAVIGALLAWLTYYAQFRANADKETAVPTLGIFSTAPEIRSPVANLVTEIIATAGLVLPILAFGKNAGIGIGPVAAPVPASTAPGSPYCWCPCWWSVSDSHSADPPDMPSIRPATSVRGWYTHCCRFRTRAPPTGVTPGSQW